ncbi:hypothetical protein VST7929_00926 [Vibrio stylophorae]|uniref:HPt domain-containing protein n=1 Tax=Vibrio stylophorae TaxID=659351 RepID=A0ABN8DRX5_9VIBR|nr:Hpt domain-containing protein [Vibrio stylophorae]CAH0533073.1 hypothetical protein VST7929_00926 [Vibrio stylophorae]
MAAHEQPSSDTLTISSHRKRSWRQRLTLLLALVALCAALAITALYLYRAKQYQGMIDLLSPMQSQSDALYFSLSRTVVRGDLALANLATSTLAFRQQALALTQLGLSNEQRLPGLQSAAVSANLLVDQADNLYANFVAHHNMAVLLQRAMQQPISARLMDEYLHFASLLLFAQIDGDHRDILQYFSQLEQRSALWSAEERQQIQALVQQISPLVARKKVYQAMTNALFENHFMGELRALILSAYDRRNQAVMRASLAGLIAIFALWGAMALRRSSASRHTASSQGCAAPVIRQGDDAPQSVNDAEPTAKPTKADSNRHGASVCTAQTPKHSSPISSQTSPHESPNHLPSSQADMQQTAASKSDLAQADAASAYRSQTQAPFGLQYMMSCFDDDIASVNMLLRIFATDHREDMTKIEQLLAKQQWEEAQRCAHSLKGVAGSLAAESLKAAAAQVEQSLRQQEPPSAILLDALSAALQDTIQAVDQHLAMQPEVSAE